MDDHERATRWALPRYPEDCSAEACGKQAVARGKLGGQGSFSVCENHLEPYLFDPADPQPRDPANAHYWLEALPGHVPCQCECGHRRADRATVLFWNVDRFFRCDVCRAEHFCAVCHRPRLPTHPSH
jgi:hypothetical protein